MGVSPKIGSSKIPYVFSLQKKITRISRGQTLISQLLAPLLLEQKSNLLEKK